MTKASTSTTEGDYTPPPVSREIVEHLHRVFRDTLPPIDTSDRELGALIGEQRVIRHLASLLSQQEEDLLSNVL